MNMQNTITAASGNGYLWFGNTLIAVRLSSSAGVDGISVVEHWMPHGEAPPLHVHRSEDEVFHILAGVMRFQVGGRERIAHAGETVIAPKGVPHAFRVDSVEGAHCLTIMRGADFETMLLQVSRPAVTPALPDPAAPTPDMIEGLVRACAANGIDIIGPPLS